MQDPGWGFHSAHILLVEFLRVTSSLVNVHVWKCVLFLKVSKDMLGTKGTRAA